MLEVVFMLCNRNKFLASKEYEPFSSVIPTVAYCINRTTLAGIEIFN